MIKLIITDMDGTLFNDKKEISSNFWEIFNKLTKDQVIFSIASGRAYYSLLEEFKAHKDKLLFICENGAYVTYKNEEIYVNTISSEGIKEINDCCKEIDDIVPLYCAKEKAYIPRKQFDEAASTTRNEILKYYNKIEYIEEMDEVKDEILKVAICDTNGAETHSYPKLKELNDKYQVVVSGSYWIDFSNIGVNKGRAIKEVQKKLNISYDETMAFGDYLNDYEMMKEAKYSYAMKNAHEKLKDIANFITEFDNNNDGVAKTISKHFKI